MAAELRLPELGESIESADVVKILIAVGDRLSVDQPILEVETNKATLEVPASADGVVREIHIKEGDEIVVGQLLISLQAAGEAPAPVVEAHGAPAPESGPGAGTADAQAAAQGAPAPEPGPGAGATDAQGAVEQQDSPAPAETGTLPPAMAVLSPEGTPSSPSSDREAVPAAPSVRRFAREIGADVNDVHGSGAHGRVSVDDVKRHARERLQQVGSHHSQPPPRYETSPLPDFEKWGEVRRERLTNIRRATAEQLTRCWNNVAHVTQFDRADITELEELRKRYADKATKSGGKLTMAVMAVKVVASALKMFPKFNASIDMETREVIYKDYVNIGIAVATERGLLVPVLRDVDKKNMLVIAAEVTDIAQRTRDKSVRLEDLQGGTFTVTNLGSIGGTHFTPIVNWPEVAILGMGRAQIEAGFEDGECRPRMLLPLSLSYDHRLIDGAEGARFLRWIVEAIEEPLLLSLEG